jgi:hypothetical protein
MELSKPLFANSGLKVVPALGELMLPSCGLLYSGTLHVTLVESCLIMASDDCFSSHPLHLMSVFPETETGEWRFRFAESLPVPINGSNPLGDG